MPDRELYYGAADDAATTYRQRDSDPNGGGDFIVAEKADGSQILLQWDDTAGEWVSGGPVNLNGNDITNVGSLDVDSAGRGNGSLWEAGSSWAVAGSMAVLVNPDDTSSTDFAAVSDGRTSPTEFTGQIVLNRIPAGASLYGHFRGQVDSVPDGETVTIRPDIVVLSDGNRSLASLSELEIEATDADVGPPITSGWQEITTVDATSWEMIRADQIVAKVTAGTAELAEARRFGLSFEWRVD